SCGVPIYYFFQAEDGIRDFHVTGVQTCALPISPDLSGTDPGQPQPHRGALAGHQVQRHARAPLTATAAAGQLRPARFRTARPDPQTAPVPAVWPGPPAWRASPGPVCSGTGASLRASDQPKTAASTGAPPGS